jgi:hypothetical protein
VFERDAFGAEGQHTNLVNEGTCGADTNTSDTNTSDTNHKHQYTDTNTPDTSKRIA